MAISRRTFLKVGAAGTGVTWQAAKGFSDTERMSTAAANVPARTDAKQIVIPHIEKMPNIPQPFKLRDWRQVAKDFDGYVFNLDAKGPFLPLVWIDKSHINFDEDTFGLYVTVDDPRCGPRENNAQFHDVLCDLPAVIGATLVGIDKSNQNGKNWVGMCKAHFGKAAGQNVFTVFDRPFSYKVGDGQGIDFWVDTLPSMLFAQLVHYYPHEPQFAELMRTSADQFCRAVAVLKNSPKGFHHQSFNFATMEPYDGTPERHWIEPESSAAFAWLEYMAYAKFRDAKYLQAATWAMNALSAEEDNPIYGCILPFGAYLSARLNAEQGSNYDTARILNWCFSGGRICVGGVAALRWGEYDVSGLVTMYDDRSYLFETFQLASSLVPLARYDPRLARAVGKWMLNAANSARFFYPGELPDVYQATPQLKNISKNLIAYEVLLGRDAKHLLPSEVPLVNQRKGASFVASRDPWECWSPATGKPYVFPPVSHFSIYSSAPVGIFGGIISPTDNEKILELDCLKTDYFHDKAYPTHLYFNPHGEDQDIDIDVGPKRVDLYDTVSKRWVKKGVAQRTSLPLGKDSAAVIVRVPSGSNMMLKNRQLLADGVVVDFHSFGSL